MQVMARLMMISILAAGLTACAGAQRPLEVPMAPMPIPSRELKEDHFKQDRTGNLTESQLQEILAAPVSLEEDTRVGIVPVATAYAADPELPVNSVPRALSETLERTGFFEVATEVSTDWPTQGSIAGLRELAARYRVKYLMLYRHRFVERERTNGWGWTYPTVVGALIAPANTIEVAGVLEATLFDVRTGTILFTSFERVHAEEDMNIWNNEYKRRQLKERLLSNATKSLSDSVSGKVQRLVAAGQARPRNEAVSMADADRSGS